MQITFVNNSEMMRKPNADEYQTYTRAYMPCARVNAAKQLLRTWPLLPELCRTKAQKHVNPYANYIRAHGQVNHSRAEKQINHSYAQFITRVTTTTSRVAANTVLPEKWKVGALSLNLTSESDSSQFIRRTIDTCSLYIVVIY